MNMLPKNLRLLLISLAILMLGSCTWAGTKLNLDTDLTLKITVAPDINPDDKRKPSPLFVRLYGLKSVKKFDKADFIGLYERDKAVLGGDFVSKQELKRLIPGKNRTEKFVLEKGTRFIGIFAEFLNYRGSRYKIIAPVITNNVFATEITVQISGNKVFVVDNDSYHYQDDGSRFLDESVIED